MRPETAVGVELEAVDTAVLVPRLPTEFVPHVTTRSSAHVTAPLYGAVVSAVGTHAAGRVIADGDVVLTLLRPSRP